MSAPVLIVALFVFAFVVMAVCAVIAWRQRRDERSRGRWR